MKVLYKFLYKNGIEDVFEQVATKEELELFNATIYETMQNGLDSVLTLGDAENTGHFICGKDVSRASITVLED